MKDGGTNVEVSEDGSKREDTTSEKEEESGGGGGLINNLVSTLIAPLSPSIGKATEHESGADDDGEKEGVDGCEEGGGIIRKMVSNFFHQSEGEGVVETEEDEIMAGGEKIKRLKTETGGIIHNIVSHLPASIPDGAVPTADEATILINSLVRD